MKKIAAVLLALVIFLPSVVLGATVNLQWDANIPTPQSYQLYRRLAGQNYNYALPAWSGTATTCTLTNLVDGATYYFVVRANQVNDQSGDSNEVEYITSPADTDGDGHPNNVDAFPNDPQEWQDTDGDGTGNNADIDDDGDGVNDAQDAFPLLAGESLDSDGDGIGNNADTDDDADLISDAIEIGAGTNPLDSESYPQIEKTIYTCDGFVYWDLVPNASRYSLVYGSSESALPYRIDNMGTASYFFFNAPEGYFFQQLAWNASNEVIAKAAVLPTSKDQVPSEVENIQIINGELVWEQLQFFEDYRVYYGSSPGVQQGHIDIQGISLKNSILSGKYVWVVALNCQAEGIVGESMLFPVVVNPLKVTGLFYNPATRKLSWTAVPGATGYKIFFPNNGNVSYNATNPYTIPVGYTVQVAAIFGGVIQEKSDIFLTK